MTSVSSSPGRPCSADFLHHRYHVLMPYSQNGKTTHPILFLLCIKINPTLDSVGLFFYNHMHIYAAGDVIMNKNTIKKVFLAYSGGLDTSVIIPWLKENYNNCEVIAVSGNVGQADELEGLEEKALKTGASKLYVLDLMDEYVEDYIIPCLKAGATYED